MWHIVAFDLPVDDKLQQKSYRCFRKKLVKAGYQALQKSFYLRWFENNEKAMSSQAEILMSPPQIGNIFTMFVNDAVFHNSTHVLNHANVPIPQIPMPWLVC